MFKNVAYKIYLLLVGMILFLGIGSIGINYYLQKQNLQFNTENQIANYHQRFQTYIDEEASMMESYLKLIEEKQNLQSLFAKSNKKELFEACEPIFQHLNKNADITHFYFIKPDGKILLRVHDFEKDSDIVNRYTFLKAKEKNGLFYGIEFGMKKNYTLRVVTPWIVNGEIIGYLELGKEVDKISETLTQQLGIELLYAVNKSEYKDSKPFVKDTLTDNIQTKEHYIVYQTLQADKDIVDFIDKNSGKPQWIKYDNDKHRHFIAYLGLLQDISKKTLGVKVYLVDITAGYHELLISILYYSAVMFLSTLLLLAVMYFVVRKKQLSLDSAMLEIETKTLEQKSLLSLFDKGDSVLFKWNNDEDWSIKYVSSNVINLLGYSQNEFLNSKILYGDCIYKDDLSRVLNEVEKGKENGHDFFRHEPYRIVTKEGVIKWVLDYTVIDKDKDDDVIHFLGYIVDITNDQENEEKLRAQKEEFEAIFKYSKDGIAIVDLETHFLDFNDAYLEITGFSKEELLTKSCNDLTAPEYKEQSKKAIDTVFETGHIENFEKICIVHNNKRIAVNLSMSLFPDKKRLLLVTKDVTSLKLLEEQTKLASMGEMIGNIAHQWRQPLSVISTNATGMMMQQEYGMLDAEKLMLSCNQINENAQYLSKTIDDFRNFIKGDINFALVNVTQVINEALSLLSANITSNYIHLGLTMEDDLLIYANKNELEQAFINIINNSKDVLIANVLEGERAIFISTKKLDEKSLELRILDNGGGIPFDVIDKIFEPYFTTKHQSQGTGLGLSMVAKIIRERHNQKLSVYNEEFEYQGKMYKGACFSIIFTAQE
ncbi:MAG: PAS domain S-box protein [Arcobacteraceae bacterium]|jgi:PAS domain S-box-containing protein|nr:PAS domain S-box protein [Arcobacteraceae bacterium]